ncbi:MAG: BACON domain-containing protein [Bacteroidales bacterium]|nr:BACON domain-containing protein [Bacteroidales bacterium]
MKKVLMAILAAAVLAAAAAGAASCEKYVLPELSLSQDTLLVNKSAQQLSLTVNSNVQWEFDVASAQVEWVIFDPEWGEVGRKVTISVEENTSGAVRKAAIPVQSQTIQKQLLIVQSGDENLPEI